MVNVESALVASMTGMVMAAGAKAAVVPTLLGPRLMRLQLMWRPWLLWLMSKPWLRLWRPRRPSRQWRHRHQRRQTQMLRWQRWSPKSLHSWISKEEDQEHHVKTQNELPNLEEGEALKSWLKRCEIYVHTWKQAKLPKNLHNWNRKKHPPPLRLNEDNFNRNCLSLEEVVSKMKVFNQQCKRICTGKNTAGKIQQHPIWTGGRSAETTFKFSQLWGCPEWKHQVCIPHWDPRGCCLQELFSHCFSLIATVT